MSTLQTVEESTRLASIAPPSWVTHVEEWQKADSGQIRFVKAIVPSALAPLEVVALQEADGRITEISLDVSMIDGRPYETQDLPEAIRALELLIDNARAALISLTLPTTEAAR